MKKITAFIWSMAAVVMVLAGCGKEKSTALEGTCADIMEEIYASAQLSEDFRTSLEYFETGELNEDTTGYMLGTTEVEYIDSAYSVPMMSSVPYQCVVLRLAPGEDVDRAKEILSANADTDKWICVEAESVAVENVGDVVLVVMGEMETVSAVKEAFLAQ